MSKKLEFAFVEKLHKGECRQRILWVYGDDSYLVSAVGKKLRNSFEVQEWMTMQDDQFDASEAVDFAMTLSFGGGDKFLEIRNLELEDLDGRSFKMLEELLMHLPDGITILFSYPSAIPKTKKNGRMMTLISRLGDECGYLELKKTEGSNPVEFFYRCVQQKGGVISKKTCKYIVEMSTADRLQLIQEADKLTAYADGAEITPQMADRLIVPTVETSAFRMADALIAGRIKNSVELLRVLLGQKEEPIKILGAFAVPFLDAYKYKIARESGVDLQKIWTAYGIKSEYRVKKGEKLSAVCSEEGLGQCIKEILQTDRALKSAGNGVDPGVRLELLMVKVDQILRRNRGRDR